MTPPNINDDANNSSDSSNTKSINQKPKLLCWNNISSALQVTSKPEIILFKIFDPIISYQLKRCLDAEITAAIAYNKYPIMKYFLCL